MVSTKVNPLEPQDIAEIDHLIGMVFLVWELFQIKEFVALWWPALQRQSRAMQAIPTDFADRMTRTSPEGRGAFIAMAAGSEAWRLHSEEAIEEAGILVDYLAASATEVSQELGEQIDWHGSVSYRTTLEYLVAPLGVPGLTEAITAWDMEVFGWRMDEAIFGDTSGPFKDCLELGILGPLTELSPAGLAKETPGRIRGRMEKKVAPLRRHYFSGAEPFQRLRQRIHLWALNKVHGKTIPCITKILESNEDRIANGDSPKRWIEQQIREANRILRAEIAAGHPRKGSVVQRWKRLL
ncbi:MAG: hypothetical protein IH870_08470 [Chloroflexi bacterium]|nr:hypothetical protein [Chloroflexota bacterium]